MPKTRKAPALKPGTLIFEVSKGLLQVGSTPNQSVLLSDLTNEEVRWVHSLRTRRARLKQLSQREEDILRLLDAANLTLPARSPLNNLNVRVVGLDRVGVRLAHLLARAQVRSLELAGEGLVDGDVENLFPRGSLGNEKRTELRRVIKSQKPELLIQKLARPDLVILCSDRVWDPGLTGSLLSQDINHLPIVADQGSITVGPLVAPGVTACTTCLDFAIQDVIPAWPKMSLALSREPLEPVPDHMCATAAGLTVAMVESVARGLPPVEGGEAVGRVGGPSYSWRLTETGVSAEEWSPHPACSCLRGLDRTAA